MQNSQSNQAGNKNCIILTCWVYFFEQRVEEVMSVAHTIDPEEPEG